MADNPAATSEGSETRHAKETTTTAPQLSSPTLRDCACTCALDARRCGDGGLETPAGLHGWLVGRSSRNSRSTYTYLDVCMDRPGG